MIAACGGNGERDRSGGAEGELSCRATSPPTSEFLVDDFEDGDIALGSVGILHGSWYVNNDGTGAQQPDPSDADAARRLVASDDSTEPPTYALHTAGSGFSRWGAFAAARLNSSGADVCSVDLSRHRSLSLRVKGSGSLRVNLGTRATTPVVDGGDCATEACSDYGFSVQLSSDWREQSIAFSELTQPEWADAAAFDPSTTLRLSFWSEASDFDFWVDDIRLRP